MTRIYSREVLGGGLVVAGGGVDCWSCGDCRCSVSKCRVGHMVDVSAMDLYEGKLDYVQVTIT